MPIYEYACVNCRHQMEVIHSVHGHGPSVCPVCGGQMRKLFSPPAIHFKGSGWAKKERTSTSATHHKKKEAGAEATGAGSTGSTESSAKPTSSGATDATSSTSSSASSSAD